MLKPQTNHRPRSGSLASASPARARSVPWHLFGGTSLPRAGNALLFCLAVFIPASFSVHYLGSQSPIRVANAIALAVMLRSAIGAWPALLCLLSASDLTAATLFGGGIGVGLAAAPSDVLEVSVAAALLRQVVAGPPLFSSLRQIVRFAAVCMTVPMLSAVASAAALDQFLGSSFLEVWPNRYLGAVFGYLVVTPFILIWTQARQDVTWRRLREVVGLALLVGIVTAIDFCYGRGSGYFCFPFLLLAAFRGGMLGATASAFVLTVVASTVTIAGWGPSALSPGMAPVGRILLLQLYLAFVLLSTLPVAVMLEHRKLLDAARAVAELSRMVRHDVLTGLPNRMLLEERLDRMRARTDTDGGVLALLLIDLDRFKAVNDLHGHAAGDSLLRQVGERLLGTLRPDDTVARIGGNEFAALCRIADAEIAGPLAQTVIDALAEPFCLGDYNVQIGCGVGISLDASGALGADILSQRAEAALSRAKSEGRNGYCLYQPELDIKVRERAELEVELRRAVAAGDIVPFFQPIVTLEPLRLVGFEMLARWPHPTRGDILPKDFIPLAEATGLIGRLTEHLLRRGCQAALTWPAPIFLAANVSPVQLRDRRLPDQIRAILADTGLAAARLDIELTESALIEDFALAREILIDLKSTGVKLTLDDFGTGYSSLRHLQGLPLDKIKIDIGFVSSMTAKIASRKIVAGVVGLGHSLNLPVVAEGIEDAVAEAALKRMGCDMGQGWLYGQAVPATETATLVGSLGSAADADTAMRTMPAI